MNEEPSPKTPPYGAYNEFGTASNTYLATDSGNVGIGTAQPQKKLHINDASGIGGILVDSSGQGQIGIRGYSDSGNTYSAIYLGADEADYATNSWYLAHKKSSLDERDDFVIGKWTNDTAATYIQIKSGSGNVGIGTASADHKLVVGPASGGRWLVVNDVPDARWGFSTGNFDLAIQNDNDGTADGTGGGAWTTRMFIAETGKVGIGTTNPSTKLTIQTTSSLDGINILDNNNVGVQFQINLGNGSWNDITTSGDRGIFYRGTNIDNPQGGFVIAPWRSGTSGIRLNELGNVGIGTATPTEKLDVNGYVKGRSGLCIGDNCKTDWSNSNCSIRLNGKRLGADCGTVTVNFNSGWSNWLSCNAIDELRVSVNCP